MIRKYAEIFCWKNVSCFCSAKATHIFSAKNIRILYIESAKTVNEMTLNELVKLTTLWTTGPWSSTASMAPSLLPKFLSRRLVFRFGNRQESEGAKFGEYLGMRKDLEAAFSRSSHSNFIQSTLWHAFLTEVLYDCSNLNFVHILSLTHQRIPTEINSFEILFFLPKMLNEIKLSN